MGSLLLLAALTWPPDCLAIGELYEKAAMLRDTGVELEKALKKTPAKRIQLALRHVYEEPDMTPRDWKMFSTGICVGQDATSKERNEKMAALCVACTPGFAHREASRSTRESRLQ